MPKKSNASTKLNSYRKIFLIILFLSFTSFYCQSSGWDSLSVILGRINPPTFPEVEYNILDYGAVEDGSVDCINAIQTAINHCSDSGGGKVVIPFGTFLTGALYLKSNVNLNLSSGSHYYLQPINRNTFL